TEHFKARQALLDTFDGIEFDVDEVQFVPQASVALEGEDAQVMEKLLDMLNYLDDVQNVYHNAA
ncbi:MAG: YebC/PmpR family DNA-binding transcriptional regulator, partial [Haliea sp.]|nr:YebC/PmpR family DNA-binding transcriptional regulator [Haliea sp.]